MAAPERTCVGCRRRRGQGELVRLAKDQGRVVVARPGAPGRGAYLCPATECLEAADKKRAFARAFRGPVTLDPSVREAIEELEKRCSFARPQHCGPAAAGRRKVVR